MCEDIVLWKNENVTYRPKGFPRGWGGPRQSYVDVVLGHTFQALCIKSRLEGKWHHCAFCGGRLRHYFLLVRDDGKLFIVGHDCAQRVGIGFFKDFSKVRQDAKRKWKHRLERLAMLKKQEEEKRREEQEAKELTAKNDDSSEKESYENFFDDILDGLDD